MKLEQDNANSSIFQINLNQHKATKDFNKLKTKLNASVIVNDMLNQLIPSTMNLIGRPRLSDEENNKDNNKVTKTKKTSRMP